jgi:arylsulfatase A-like enzyme
MGNAPWVLHLSYVKPHWPYVAPAPYHAMYRADQCPPSVRNAAERENEHPALAAYRQHEESLSFARDDCVRTVRPVYQGLVHQLDDHLGRLFEAMDRQGVLQDTLVIFTADHGDFLGDHWLGEKELFYDTVQRVPLIVVDPRRAADATRGTTDDRFVEAVDILPTILGSLGQPLATERLEGRSLLPLLHGENPPWRDFVYAELDYSFRQARLTLGRGPQDCRAFSIRSRDWRYVHWGDLPEQLYDLRSDPDQFQDLGREAGSAGTRAVLRDTLLGVLQRSKRRVTVEDAYVLARTNTQHKLGIHFGRW